MTAIVEIPCHGTFTHIIRPHGLIADTHADPERYRQTLSAIH